MRKFIVVASMLAVVLTAGFAIGSGHKKTKVPKETKKTLFSWTVTVAYPDGTEERMKDISSGGAFQPNDIPWLCVWDPPTVKEFDGKTMEASMLKCQYGPSMAGTGAACEFREGTRYKSSAVLILGEAIKGNAAMISIACESR